MILAAIEAGDPIAYDLMVRLAEELAEREDGERAGNEAAREALG